MKEKDFNAEMSRVHRYACILCSRSWPDTILNVEAGIQYKGQMQCEDTTSCLRAQRADRQRRKQCSTEV